MGRWLNLRTLVTTLIGVCLMSNLAGGPAGADTCLDDPVASFIGKDPGDRSGYSVTGARIQRRDRY